MVSAATNRLGLGDKIRLISGRCDRPTPHPSLPRPRGRVREGACQADTVGTDRSRDVLERLLADVLEGELKAARRVLLNAGRDADAARFGQAFEPRRDIDAIAKDVAALDDDVPDIDADADFDTTVSR